MISTEAKVGSVSIVALLMLAYIIINLGSFSFGDKGYPMQIIFPQVNGLKQGNILRYAGVDIGQVKEITVLPEGVKVIAMINPGVKIPEGSKFTIGSEGLVGEKYINISPPYHQTGFLPPNAIVRGEDIQGFDQLVASSDKVLGEIHQLVKSINEIIGDDKVKAAIKEALLNAKNITANLDAMSAALARMAENNEGNVNTMMSNLSEMAITLRDVAGRVDAMMIGIDNDGQTVRDLRETIQNIKSTSARIEKMAAALDGVVTDPETAKNIKETLRNARSVSEKANKMLSKVDSISVKTGVEELYDRTSGKYHTNVGMRINTSPKDFAIIGVTGIGDSSKGNLQIGKGDEEFATRAGIVESKVGMGVDTKLGKQLKLSVDVYDPNDVRVKLRTQYQLNPNTFLIGETDSINKAAEKRTYLGVGQNF